MTEADVVKWTGWMMSWKSDPVVADAAHVAVVQADADERDAAA